VTVEKRTKTGVFSSTLEKKFAFYPWSAEKPPSRKILVRYGKRLYILSAFKVAECTADKRQAANCLVMGPVVCLAYYLI
jgi:hypothetical protein